MKGLIRLFVIVAVIFSFTGMAYAGTPLEKLGRGVANVTTCPMEVFKQIRDTNDESGPLGACTVGVMRGIACTFVRCLVGGFEILTFSSSVPGDYAPILTDPEYFFQSETNTSPGAQTTA